MAFFGSYLRHLLTLLDASPRCHRGVAQIDARHKLGFYAAHHVDELLIVDPAKRKVDWLALGGDTYRPTTRSALIDLTAADLAARLTWSAPARSQSS